MSAKFPRGRGGGGANPVSAIGLSVQFRYLTFQPDPEVRGVCKVEVLASMLVYTSFPLIWYATWPHSDFFTHRLTVCVRTEYVLAWCSKPHSLNLICNMTTFRKIDPTPGAEGVCKDRICACIGLYAPFPLIWYATWLLSVKKNVLTFWPHPRGRACV